MGNKAKLAPWVPFERVDAEFGTIWRVRRREWEMTEMTGGHGER